jgi:hypothetical protein
MVVSSGVSEHEQDDFESTELDGRLWIHGVDGRHDITNLFPYRL